MRLVFCKQIDGADVTECVNRADFVRMEDAESAAFNHGRPCHTNR